MLKLDELQEIKDSLKEKAYIDRETALQLLETIKELLWKYEVKAQRKEVN